MQLQSTFVTWLIPLLKIETSLSRHSIFCMLLSSRRSLTMMFFGVPMFRLAPDCFFPFLWKKLHYFVLITALQKQFFLLLLGWPEFAEASIDWVCQSNGCYCAPASLLIRNCFSQNIDAVFRGFRYGAHSASNGLKKSPATNRHQMPELCFESSGMSAESMDQKSVTR